MAQAQTQTQAPGTNGSKAETQAPAPAANTDADLMQWVRAKSAMGRFQRIEKLFKTYRESLVKKEGFSDLDDYNTQKSDATLILRKIEREAQKKTGA